MIPMTLLSKSSPVSLMTPLYYLGARINVLSWRVINQSVDL